MGDRDALGTHAFDLSQGSPQGLISQDMLYRAWYSGVVEEYSKRQLTYGRNKLVAISALAEVFRMICQGDYIAGIWRESLMDGLRWRRSGSGKKSSSYRCPSWSWASQDSAVRYNFSQDGIAPDASIISVEARADLHSRYEAVTSGSLTLRAALLSAIVKRDRTFTWGYEMRLGLGDELAVDAEMDNNDLVVKHVHCAYLGLDHFDGVVLILEHDRQENTYQQIGYSERIIGVYVYVNSVPLP
ncbi:hypothetical protein F4823DRAFT_598570 [Ustulina deusta]|nr:hypothetical protein F4823DRAFT_598570 [Ustulina deusta]